MHTVVCYHGLQLEIRHAAPKVAHKSQLMSVFELLAYPCFWPAPYVQGFNSGCSLSVNALWYYGNTSIHIHSSIHVHGPVGTLHAAV